MVVQVRSQEITGDGGKESFVPARILLVDADEDRLAVIRYSFEPRDRRVSLTIARSLVEASRTIASAVPDLVIGSLRLPDGSCMELLEGSADPSFPLVVLAEPDQEQAAAEAMKDGALDYILCSKAVLGAMAHLAERAIREWRHRQERRQAALEQSELEAQVRHVQKLESLGVLAGGIAHDFNNLLVGILGNAALAKRIIPTDVPGVEILSDIEEAAMRAADLCHQMLAYAGKGVFSVEPMAINSLVREMPQLLGASISKKSLLTFNLTKDLPEIMADSTQIRQVIMNLIINAAEAIGDGGGRITLTTGVMECDGAYLRETLHDEPIPEGLYCYLEVVDTGCGMNAETIQKVFDPFFTTKFAGRGLGLSAVVGIVNSHKGTILVDSTPGVRTKFRVLLPALERRTRSRRAQVQDQSAWRGSGTVLVVDDEDAVRRVSQRLLATVGFETIAARNGREAVAIYRARAHDISLVLLDLTMPEMDGEETFSELKKIQEDVQVLLCSGYHDPHIQQVFAARGVAGFVRKPFSGDELISAVRGVVELTADVLA